MEECSERSQSEAEESEANIFVYQSISHLIPQGEKDWDGDDGTEWLRSITIGEVQDDPSDDILPQTSQRKEDGNELESSKSTTEVNVDEMQETGPITNTDDVVSQMSFNDQEEEYFGDDEKEESKRPKFISMKPEDLASEIEDNDEDDDEKESTEIVLNPGFLNLSANTQPAASSPGSQIPPTTTRLARKQSLGNKIFQTLQRNLPTPGKNLDKTPKANKKSKKEKIKVILF